MDSISAAIGTATGVLDDATRIMEDRLAAINTLENDRDFVRENIREAIRNAATMLPSLVSLAKIAESPNLYNSASQFLNTFVDLNETLIDIGIKVDKHKATDPKSSGGQNLPALSDEVGLTSATPERGAFNGSTEDFLQFCLSQMKGKTEVIKPDDDFVDMEDDQKS